MVKIIIKMIICTQQDTFNLLPTTTIGDLKEYIKGKGYNPTAVQLKLGDGTLISPIVFNTDTYDKVNFHQYKSKLKGSILIIDPGKNIDQGKNIETNKNKSKNIDDPDIKAMIDEVMHDKTFGPIVKILFSGIL